jgi:dienelactone hydrolase
VIAARRASLAFVAGAAVLVTAGCGAVVRQIEVPRPPGAFDTSQGPAAVSGYLTRPDGDGPFGAVILLHGCSGLTAESRRHQLRWAQWYRDRGWVSVVLDSFGPRGVSNVCMRNQVTPYDRAGDAYAALRYLGTLPFVRRERIVVHGLSHGGWTVLRALEETMYGEQPQKFAGGIAFYPVCSGIRRPLYAPALVLIGELDDWTPAMPCQSLEARTRDDAHPIGLTIYPGAYHGFDFTAPRRVNEYGKTLGYDDTATTDAERRIDAFLRQLR